MKVIKGRINRLERQFAKANTDKDIIEIVKENNDLVEFVLDNDSTHVDLLDKFDWEDWMEELDLPQLDEFTGNAKGVYTLFEMLGITARGC